MPQSQVPTVARVRDVFEQVLADPDFQVRGTPPIVEFFGRVWDAILRFVARWMPNVGEAQVRVVSWVLLAATIAVLAIFAWRWFDDRRSGRPRRSQAAPAVPAPRDSAGWIRWARDEAGEGRLREAATGLYQAVILHLESRGALRYGEWKTPGDYAIETSGDDALRGPFRSFLAQFVALAFGPVEPTRQALDNLFARAEDLGCPS